ncbi:MULTISPECIES: TAXI family TRAP transporter solute-binding subunit [Sutcliffiella]|uniref:C4-dicarboxylate ABC transporter substrate-binding protein n=1 Tax=Sutcliffiella cohnii TaxID=33932 RepID=A0A223KV98_9BACI|nr:MULTISPECIES: TAXI family TRAP transporter solute-binding subunit [Sutcliffiella]AST93402.1 C4-dicarboxylate ABC transporter substrate-binding protein [Sutcliffiella cohnii]WBL14568.1 TAXI family TRAP transporter solute-binding subunit [Sutcliffiella sp. NC1]
MKRIALLFVSVLLIGTVLAACGGNDSGGNASEDGLDTNIVTIATGGSSGPYHIIGTTLANEYTNTFDVNSKPQSTGASVENINLIKEGKVEMAFVMSDVLTDAVNGTGSFSEPVTEVAQMARLYPNYVQIITTANSGIETVEDLVGKRVAVGDQNSGVEVNARNLLAGHGITYDDITVDYLGYAEAADGLKSGAIDAAFLTSGLPNASVLELSKTLDIKLVSVKPENIEKIAQDQPYFVSLEIPADTYGNAEPIPTAAIMNALVVSSDLSEDDVYQLTKLFFEKLDVLGNSHQAATEVTLELAQEGTVAPVHPGAQKYYDEQK